MALRWFDLRPADADFLDAAPVRLHETFDVPRPAADVWAELTAERPLGWCRLLREIVWTSPRPFAVGTTRTARSWVSTLHERYFRWEEGRLMSFHVEQASVPSFRRFAEDYLVEPAGDGACRFQWTVAYEPMPWARAAAPMNRRLLGTLFRDTRRHYGLP